jgi:hypothetical protein
VFGYGAAKSTGSTVDALPASNGPRSEFRERAAPEGQQLTDDNVRYDVLKAALVDRFSEKFQPDTIITKSTRLLKAKKSRLFNS